MDTQPDTISSVPTPKPKVLIERIRSERIAITITLGLLAATIALLITWDSAIVLETGALTTIILLSAIHTANFMFGFGGGFVERFPEDQRPQHANTWFSIMEYWKDAWRLLLIVAALLVIMILIKSASLLIH